MHNVTVLVRHPHGVAGRCLGTSELIRPLGTLHVVVGRAGGARTGDGTLDSRVVTWLVQKSPKFLIILTLFRGFLLTCLVHGLARHGTCGNTSDTVLGVWE